MTIPGTMRVEACKDVAACELDSGAALIDLRSGVYYQLNGTGRLVWQKIAAPIAFDDLAAALTQHFNVPKDILVRDLEAMLSELNAQGLITLHEDA